MGSSIVSNFSRGSGPSPDMVRRQLERMLASKPFANAARLSKFLKYGVEAALAGTKGVNEYSIAIDVLGRDITFDPRVDPIVRVHARRLRSKLAQYYQTEGIEDPVEVRLPLRCYVPSLHFRNTPTPRSTHPAGSAQGTQDRFSIAVFPFRNLSHEQGEEYFVEGLMSEVVHSLARNKEWRVVSWTTEQRRAEVNDIAQQLGVQRAVYGTVRKAEKKLRISVELNTVPDRTVLWSDLYTVEMENLVATQQKIAESICRALSCEFVVPTERVSSKAFQLYLKGRYGCVKRNQRGLTKCVDLLQQSIAIDPQYGPSHAALAEARVLMTAYAEARPRDVMPSAKIDAQRALEYSPGLAEAHVAAGLVSAFFDWDMASAEAEFLRAIEIAPSSASALKWYAGACLVPEGRYEEAISRLRRAQELDPLLLTIPYHLAYAYCAADNPDAALDQLYEYLDIEPDFPLTHWSLGLAYVVKSEYEHAIEEFEIAATLSSHLSYAVSSLAHAYALAGNITRAGSILEELLERSRSRYVPAIDLALVSLGLNRQNEALAYVEAAFDERCTWLSHAKIDPRFRSLLPEPPFQKVFKSA